MNKLSMWTDRFGEAALVLLAAMPLAVAASFAHSF